MSKLNLVAVAVAASCGLLAAGASKAATYTYAVTIKNGTGEKTTGCFVFDKGVLTIDATGATFDYTAAPTVPVHFYTAVLPIKEVSGYNLNLALAGYNTGTATSGKLHAVGADNHHGSYTIEGYTVATCVPPSDGKTIMQMLTSAH